VRILVHLIAILASGGVAIRLALRPPDPRTDLWLLVLGPAGTVLVAAVGRLALQRWAPAEAAIWVTTLVHYTFATLAGASIIAAGYWGATRWGPALPLPAWACDGLAVLLGVPGWSLFAASALNLAINRLGAPFAVALTRRLAADWLYARVRNPMRLGVFLYSNKPGVWLAVGAVPALACVRLYPGDYRSAEAV